MNERSLGADSEQSVGCSAKRLAPTGAFFVEEAPQFNVAKFVAGEVDDSAKIQNGLSPHLAL